MGARKKLAARARRWGARLKALAREGRLDAGRAKEARAACKQLCASAGSDAEQANLKKKIKLALAAASKERETSSSGSSSDDDDDDGGSQDSGGDGGGGGRPPPDLDRLRAAQARAAAVAAEVRSWEQCRRA